MGASGVPQVGVPSDAMKLGPTAFCKRGTRRFPTLTLVASLRLKLKFTSHVQRSRGPSVPSRPATAWEVLTSCVVMRPPNSDKRRRTAAKSRPNGL
jgi:hypothetical protein